MIIEDYIELQKIREENTDKTIVFCSGSFDLPHAGHSLFLKNCKEYGDILVASVGKDADIKKNKGEERPIIEEGERLRIIDEVEHVDYAFLTNSPEPNGHYLSPIEEIFKILKPNIYVFNTDASYIEEREKLAREHDIEIKLLEEIRHFHQLRS